MLMGGRKGAISVIKYYGHRHKTRKAYCKLDQVGTTVRCHICSIPAGEEFITEFGESIFFVTKLTILGESQWDYPICTKVDEFSAEKCTFSFTVGYITQPTMKLCKGQQWYQGCTTCCTLTTGLRENGERMRKRRENEKTERE